MADANGVVSIMPQWEPCFKVTDEELQDSGAAIRAVACTDELVVTSSSRPVVKVWQVAEAAVKQTQRLSLVDLHGAVGSSCVEVAGAGSGSERLVAVCYDDGGIGIWDLRSGNRAMELAATIPTAWKAKFLPGGQGLVSGGPSGSLCFWDLRAGGRLDSEVGFSPSRNDLASKRRRKEGVEDPADLRSPIYSLAVSPDGTLLGCGKGSGIISIMRLEDHEWAGDVRAHSGEKSKAVRSVTFDANSKLVLSGGDDCHLSLFDAEIWARHRSRGAQRNSQLERFSAHRGWVTSVSVCPDPRQHAVVTTSWDGTVKLWNYSTHTLLQTYKEHEDGVFSSAFAPTDGRFFVTVGADAQLAMYVAKGKMQ